MRIDMDTCEEILITITRNKTRSLLTAFGVFWGIFMLVALIGGGQGLEGMMKKNFEGFATNSGFLAAQKTGEAYKGFRKGRWWNLEAIDIERLRSKVKDVEVITPSIARWGSKAVYEDKKYDCSVKGLYPDYLHIESQEMAYGRFINEVDIQEARKVCVIGKRIYESLFKPGEDPCGKYENIITIGMRGERDSLMLGEDASLEQNISLLKEIITEQRKLIRECVGENEPEMLALYKEVEAYYYGDETTPGLKDWDGLDGVTLIP